MKKEIRLMLDYQCYPIWIYDENGKFIDNDLIDEIEEDNNVITMLEKLQDRFDSLYVNNKNEFKYVGFSSSEDKKKFETSRPRPSGFPAPPASSVSHKITYFPAESYSPRPHSPCP